LLLALVLLRGLSRLGHEVLHHANDDENNKQGQKHALICARFALRITIFSQMYSLLFGRFAPNRFCGSSSLLILPALRQAARRPRASRLFHASWRFAPNRFAVLLP
jgi:hypothetical protein